MKLASALLTFALLAALASVAQAEEVGCTSTTFRVFGANDKICVYAFDDPQVPGVACHISQARTGGISGSLGLADVQREHIDLFQEHEGRPPLRPQAEHAGLCRDQPQGDRGLADECDLDRAYSTLGGPLNERIRGSGRRALTQSKAAPKGRLLCCYVVN